MVPQKYDIVLVLGSGIKQDGSLPQSSLSCVNKAVELLKSNTVTNIILSGKYSHSIDFIPPRTEAAAMREHALSLGVLKENIFTEDKSFTTVSNICQVKSRILKKFHWNKIILVSIYPQSKRSLYNLKRVLGKNFKTKLILADFSYPTETLSKLREIEKEKYKDAINFYRELP